MLDPLAQHHPPTTCSPPSDTSQPTQYEPMIYKMSPSLHGAEVGEELRIIPAAALASL